MLRERKHMKLNYNTLKNLPPLIICRPGQLPSLSPLPLHGTVNKWIINYNFFFVHNCGNSFKLKNTYNSSTSVIHSMAYNILTIM